QAEPATNTSLGQDHVVEGGSSKVTGTSKKPERICKFCHEWQTHLKRHIIRRHKNEMEVIAALDLPQKEQAHAFAAMRKAGTYEKNMELSKERQPLIRERRQGKSDTVMCSGCHGFYDRKTIFKHKRSCTKSFSQNPCHVQVNRLSDNAESLDLPNDFITDVLQRFRHDLTGDLCRKDLAVLLLGKRLWSKSFKKERHTIMSEMRSFSNLIIKFRKHSSNKNAGGVDILHYSQFDILEKAINEMTADEENKSKSGLKLRLGFILKRASKVMRGYYITKGEFKKEEEINRFLNALHLQWDFIFYTAQVECESKREGLRKPAAMPDKDDINHLRDHINQKMKLMLDDSSYEFWDNSSFVCLRNLIVARLTMFNARRSGEPVRLTLSEWRDGERAAWIDQNLVEEITDPQERALLRDMKLCYQAGKGSRKLVPVIIPKDTLEPITKLILERETCGVHPDNRFLFPNTQNSLDHASGYHCLRAVVRDVPNLKAPHLLIADKFRHMVSTIFASLELPEEQRNVFIRHMGHSEAVNRNVYQCPMAVREVTRVGQFLSTIDKGHQSTSYCQEVSGMQQETGLENNVPNQPPHEHPAVTSSMNIDHPSFDGQPLSSDFPNINDQETAVVTSSGLNSQTEKEPRQRRYTKWSEQDSRLIKEYFHNYIVDTSTKGRLPPKSEIVKFLADHEILNDHNNKALLVRTKIFNEKKKFREGCFTNV
ncbi:hypothetical protein EGW08_023510, partial [Elysia chlorotica]